MRREMRRIKEFGFFHVCTDGRAIPWLFKDDKDFIAGINRIAICHFITGITVISFILMDNHVHFVLEGTMPDCKKFINLYKRLTGKWISVRYGIQNYIKHLPTDIILIENEDSLLNTLAYIDRNASVAGYKYISGDYPWGISQYMFRECNTEEHAVITTVGNMSRRKQKMVFNTNEVIPDTWKVNDKGMIIPSSYINIKRIESFYKTSTRYLYFLAKKLEGIVEMNLEGRRKSFIPDKELRIVVKSLISEAYGDRDIKLLDVNSKLAIARKLRYEYGSTVKQISRMLSIDFEILSNFI